MKIDNKATAGRFDPVTAADRAAERAIAKTIKADWPDHGIVGEEYGTKLGTSSYRWVIDPIDGTKAFILGFPLWGTLIGLMDDDQAVLGMMNQPFTGERFWSGPTSATMRSPDGRERRIKTRACATLGKRFVHVLLTVQNRHLNFTVKNSSDPALDDKEIKANIGLTNLKGRLILLYKKFDLVTEQKDATFTAVLKINLASDV